MIKLDRIDDAKAVLHQAKSNGAKGDAFDKLAIRLGSSTSKNSNAPEPPQEQLENLLNLYTQGQHNQALNQALQLQQQFPKSVNLFNIIGAVNKSLGKLDDAIIAYQNALSIKPDLAETHYNMGNALKDQGKLEEAIEAYNKAIAIKPDYAEAYYNMGIVLKDQGKLEEAIEAYDNAVSVKPDYAEARNNIGITLKEQDKLDEAIEAYRKALSIKPDYAEVYYNMGIVLKDQGSWPRP